jgi:polyribonucleotide nucleotidyltransferase
LSSTLGLIIESEKKFAVLTDLMGIEDFNGDMDFKVAGTASGITALQLDVKTLNLTASILREALQNAKVGREKIMKVITDAISAPRATVSKYAPKIKVVKIPVDKIGEFIGPSGKNVKKLSADLGVEFNTADDGSVSISGVDEDALNKAVAYLEGFAKVVQAGEIYEGEVVRLMSFGAFVNILPGKDGMVHVTDMGQEGFVNDASDVVKIGQKIQVRVKEVDDQGRINLSMNMDPSKDKPKEERPRSGGFNRGGDRGGRSFGGGRQSFGGGDRRSGGFNRGPRTGGFGGNRGGFSRDTRDRGATGPHFPTSRLMGDSK